MKWKPCLDQVKEVLTQKTIAACIDADADLEREGLDPAPEFRKAVKSNDERYICTWVLGCHFKWLNPRRKPD